MIQKLSLQDQKHPLDPLSKEEILQVAKVVKKHFSGEEFIFNTISLQEPIKKQFYAWKDEGAEIPERKAFFVIIKNKRDVHDGIVSLVSDKVLTTKKIENSYPILSPSDLLSTESIVKKDPAVIEQCLKCGVPEDELDNVCCDAWAVGYDERWGTERRLQQALMYWKSDEDDSHYSHPLDFCPIVDIDEGKVIYIDIPNRRRKVSKHKHSSFHPKHIRDKFGSKSNPSGYRDSKPINITQPEGVSFSFDGNYIEWSNFKFHIGFNYREGIVLSDIAYNDHGKVRPMFHRMSLAEMIVPYGNPDHPHQRKHALDIGEYGAGNCTNPLTLGCDCKGVIHYMDAHFVDKHGEPLTVKNAVCIHEEDDGLLFKHSDFRDDFQTTVVTRGKRLIISQIFTAANYEYCLYWIFRQDGTIKLEIRLTGILNTFVCADDEDIGPWGTVVYPNVNAHNHQHLFSLRVHPRIDGDNNSAGLSDAKSASYPTGSKENKYGNAFYCDKQVFKTVSDSLTNFESSTARSWDLFNPSSINPYSKKPASYKLVSTFCSPVLAHEGSLVRKRAPWAKYSTEVVPYKDDEHGYGRIYPSGVHVCQQSGEKTFGIQEWMGDGSDNIENTDIVLFHSFGITHFPAPEDFPVMPTEIFDLMFRPRHFFTENPCLDVKPSHARTVTEVKNNKLDSASLDLDKASTLAFSGETTKSSCCSK